MFSLEGRRYDVPDSFIAQFLRSGREAEPEYFTVLCIGRAMPGRRSVIEGDGIDISGIFFDTPYNFVLVRGNNACASLGFDPLLADFSDFRALLGIDREGRPVDHRDESIKETYPSATITVKQIQGARGAQERLALIRWEKFLLHIAMKWAFLNGFREVRVPCAEENPWYNRFLPDEEQHRFKMRYNVTPRRMGFIPSMDQTYTYQRATHRSLPSISCR